MRVDIVKIFNKLKKIEPHLIIIFIFIALHVFLFTYLSFVRYFSFNTGFDLCLHDRNIWAMTQGRISPGILEHEESFRSYHFFMIYWIFLPLYIVFPTPLTLLFLQTFFLATGAIPIYLLAKEKLDSKLAGTIFAICYLLYPAIQNINLFEFHSIAIATPLLLWSFYFIEKNDVKKSIIFIILSMLCKENVVFVVILLGFYTLIKNKNYKLGLTIVFLSSFWAFFTLFVMFPYTYNGHYYFDAWSVRWNDLGDTSAEVVVNFIKNPIYAFTSGSPEKKIEYLTGLFSPLGFLSLLNPGTMLIVLHEFIFSLSSSESSMYSLNFYYSALPIPFIFISAIYGVRFICSKLKLKYLIYLILFFILITTLASNIYFSSAPITSYGDRLNEIINFKISDHDKLLFDIIDSIPKNSSLVVQQALCAHSSHVKKVYFLLGYVINREVLYKNETIDYIILDKTKPFNLAVEEVDNFIKNISNEFVNVSPAEGIFLYKHK